MVLRGPNPPFTMIVHASTVIHAITEISSGSLHGWIHTKILAIGIPCDVVVHVTDF